jgi:undecaprenyl-diphosphatase
VVAGGLAATGAHGRRAAVRSLLGLALASTLANLPAKFAVRRRRPPLTTVPLSRQLQRQPSTLSFPSGHAASAAGFAVGAAVEWPAVAAPVGALAAGVAWSRVHTGVHYPGDVLAGVLLGGAVSLALTRPWPPKTALPTPAEPEYVDAPALPDGDGLVFVVNPRSGHGKGESLADQLRERLPKADCMQPLGDEDIVDTLRRAAKQARILGVCGGDGTINAAAAVALEEDKPLVVLPGGTLNHFAHDLGNEDIDSVVEAVRVGCASRVDIGETEDGIFLNTAGIGGYPEMVALREQLENNIGKWPALVVSLVRTLRRSLPMDVEVDGERRCLWLLFVGNGQYEPPGVALASRVRLDDGLLDVRMVAADRWARTRVFLAALAGRLHRCSAYDAFLADQLTVRMCDEPRPAARDGEVSDPVESVHFRKRVRALTVYRPRSGTK